jgi:chemotaxis protein CheD
MKQHYLKPAEAIILTGEATVTTVLGSCISVTFFHPAPRFAAIIHGVLPFVPKTQSGAPNDIENIFKYVDSSIQYIVKRLQEKGVDTQKMQVKVFGGADVLGHPCRSSISVGQKNIASAMITLAEMGINVTATDVGGTKGRKLIFHTQTGYIFLKRLHSQRDALAAQCTMHPKISEFSA